MDMIVEIQVTKLVTENLSWGVADLGYFLGYCMSHIYSRSGL